MKNQTEIFKNYLQPVKERKQILFNLTKLWSCPITRLHLEANRNNSNCLFVFPGDEHLLRTNCQEISWLNDEFYQSQDVAKERSEGRGQASGNDHVHRPGGRFHRLLVSLSHGGDREAVFLFFSIGENQRVVLCCDALVLKQLRYCVHTPMNCHQRNRILNCIDIVAAGKKNLELTGMLFTKGG